MKTAKNRSGKGILVIDIDDENQSNHDDFIKISVNVKKLQLIFVKHAMTTCANFSLLITTRTLILQKIMK